jgi:methyltransferase-like protein
VATLKNYKTNKECYKFYKDNIKKKIATSGISEDLFEALKELYNNINFQEVSDRATKNNNELICSYFAYFRPAGQQGVCSRTKRIGTEV